MSDLRNKVEAIRHDSTSSTFRFPPEVGATFTLHSGDMVTISYSEQTGKVYATFGGKDTNPVKVIAAHTPDTP